MRNPENRPRVPHSEERPHPMRDHERRNGAQRQESAKARSVVFGSDVSRSYGRLVAIGVTLMRLGTSVRVSSRISGAAPTPPDHQQHL